MPTPFYKRMLGKAAKKIIEDAVDMLFNRAKQRLIGPESLDKRIYYTANPLSLPGLYRAASDSEQNSPDHDLLESVMEVANGYIEKSRQSTKLKIVNTIESFLREARTKNIKTDLHTVLQGQLAEIWQTTSNDMKKIVDTESTNIRNVATLDGIVKINAASGITDPMLYFVVTRDQHLCLQKEEWVVDDKGNYVQVKDLKIGDKLKTPTPTITDMGSQVLYVQPRQEEIIHLIFDNGKEIKCTQDHPILVKAGPTYCFIEAHRIREDHEVVFLDEKTNREERYAMGFSDKVRGWMGSYPTAWSFWKENINIFLESLLRTKRRTEMVEKYNIPVEEWENYIRYILKVYVPPAKWIDDCFNNSFNKKHRDTKKASLVKKENIGVDTVIELTVEGGIYQSANGMISHNCDICKSIHTLNVTIPRLWYLSEIGHGYHKKGETNPKIGGLHPHCFRGDQKLLTTEGWITFSELFKTQVAPEVIVDGRIKNKKDTQGKRVAGQAFFTSTLGPAQFLKASPVYETGIQECIRFEFRGTKQYPIYTSLEVSLGHEMWIVHPKQEEALKVRADQVKIGDLVPSMFYEIGTKKQFTEDPYLVITAIERIGKHPTYCLTEPMTHTVTVNGITTGQCRCSLVTMFPGYTFDENGYVTYKEPGWLEINHQRGIPQPTGNE